MNQPKVSIVLPTYNVENFIHQTMESVLNQTLSDIEIIAVDDGSPDECGRILDEYALQDDRVTVIHKENGGYGTAVNAGIEVAKGDYIGIVETDDYVEQDMFESLWSQACESGADISRGSYNVLEDEQVARKSVTFGTNQGIFDLSEYPEFMMTPPAIWSAIYRKEFLDSNGLRVIGEKGISYQDVDFFVRTAILARKIICTAKPVYNYRLDNPASSSNNTKKIDDIFVSYRITDAFVERVLSQDSQRHMYYDKRKICDLQWHFFRLRFAPKSRYYFAKKVSKYLKFSIGNSQVTEILDAEQKRFYKYITMFPRLITFYKNNEGFFDKMRSLGT